MFGFSRRVSIAEEVSVGIEADVDFQGTELLSASNQETSAGTKTLLTASSGKRLLVKRIEFTVDVDQSISAGTFKAQVVGDSGTLTATQVWNPKTSAVYGINISPDFMKGKAADSVKFVIPTGFTDKLDWTVHYQEVDA